LPCSGCGGKKHTRGETFGHILGCGANEFMEDPRYNPLEKELQRQILAAAVDIASKSGHKPGSIEFVDALGNALFEVLHEKCVERTPY
jgi:hypothetical protein